MSDRRYDLRLELDWTHPTWPYAIKDTNTDEVIVRHGSMRSALAWMLVFQQSASVTVDRGSVESVVAASGRVPRLRVVGS